MVAPMMRSYTDCMTSSGLRGARDAGRGARDPGGVTPTLCKALLDERQREHRREQHRDGERDHQAMATVNDIARMNSPARPAGTRAAGTTRRSLTVAASTGTANSVGERQAASGDSCRGRASPHNCRRRRLRHRRRCRARRPIRQRHLVELDTDRVENRHGDRDGDRDRDRGDRRDAKREEHHRDKITAARVMRNSRPNSIMRRCTCSGWSAMG